MNQIRRLRWRLDEDGGGEAWLFEPKADGSGVSQHKYVFDSLDDPRPPRELAQAIRESGEESGEVELP